MYIGTKNVLVNKYATYKPEGECFLIHAYKHPVSLAYGNGLHVRNLRRYAMG